MNTLTNTQLNVGGKTFMEFLYSPTQQVLQNDNAYRVSINNMITRAVGDPLNVQNEEFIGENLGMNVYEYDLNQAWKNSGDENNRSLILREKIDRLTKFKKLVINFTLELINMLYWINPRVIEKSNLGLTKSVNFALGIGKEIASEFMKRLDKEYNVDKLIKTEYGKKYAKKVV